MCIRDSIPAVPTAAVQIWLDRTTQDLGWTAPIPKDGFVIGATYANPTSGQADFSELIKKERWGADAPKSLWYFCGPLYLDEPVAPFSDHAYPGRCKSALRTQAVQYLQSSMGALLPKATTDATQPSIARSSSLATRGSDCSTMT